MSNINAYVQTFAGGEFGAAMSARANIDSYQASCELSENWISRAQGPIDRRPPLQYIGSFEDSTQKGILKGFEFDAGQNYPLLLTNMLMYFYLNDGIVTVPAVTATIANGTFANFSGWTDASDSGASATASNGYMNLVANGISVSRARTTFTVNEANVEHILSFDVQNGPVVLRVGTSAGGIEYLHERELRRGHHQIAFTPTATGTAHIQFAHGDDSTRLVDNISFLTSTNFTLPTPWPEADLRGIFTAQDGDRLWMMHRNYASRILERRGHRSWSLIYFEPDDGPFDPGLTTISIGTSNLFGETTLTASGTYFKATDVRRLVRITHSGQFIHKVFNKDGLISKHLKVAGLAGDRGFRVKVVGTFTGNLTLERSVGNENAFSKVITITAAQNLVYNDSYPLADAGASGSATSDAVYAVSQADGSKGRMDNTTVFYRVSVYSGDWTSGLATVELTNNSGSQTGISRITQYVSPTQVIADVLRQYGRQGQSDVWDIGSWNDVDEWPNVVAFAHGRLWPFRRRQVWASAPDDYFSFQDGVEADNAIALTLRSRSAEGVRWARELDFLCVGTRNEEYVIRSTSPNEPIGPTSAEPTLQGEEGGALIEATIGGDSIVYVHRNERRVMQFAHNPRALSESSFLSIDLTRLNPESCEEGIVSVVVQQEPERRIYTVLKSGVVKPSLFRREEEIMGWSTMTTAGLFEDALVLREGSEDAVYFLTRRKIAGTWVRMLERLRSEVVLNDEDLVHLDAMLETDMLRPTTNITPTSLVLGAVTINAIDDVFSLGGIDSFAKSTLHFNGADASTSFTDESGKIWTAAGNAQIDTAISKFGGAAGLFDGTGDYITTPDHADFTLGVGDWTVDAWFNCTAVTGSFVFIMSQGDSGGSGTSINLFRTNTNVMRGEAYVGGSGFVVTGTTQFTNLLNTGWHHIAFVRIGNILKLFIDGIQEGGDLAISGAINNSAFPLTVGARADTAAVWQGSIDEFRFSVGIARWTANFTPPPTAYTDDATGAVGKILWLNGGRVRIGAYVNAKQVTGTVIFPLQGKLDYIASQAAGRPIFVPVQITSGRWGMAVETSVVSGLAHLEGMAVDIWADMTYRGSQTVTGGQVTLASPSSRIFVGLGYTSIWKSLKLAYGATKGTAINQPKKVTHMGLLLDRASDTILMGDTPGKLKKLVKLSQAAVLGGAARLFSGEAHETFEGTFDVDPRIIIASANPGPATIKAIIPNIQVNERA